ncbi:hypothetical protein FSP39_018667, partial [Pinctada imbricata]
TKKRVCILGAGVAGLAGVKHCLDDGMDPVCYEKDTDIGGLWNYHNVAKDGDPGLYNSCSINTSKEMTCYSDFPIPKEFPNFMAHKHFKKYLDLYASNFNLRKHIKFQHMIERIQKADNFEENGQVDSTCQELEPMVYISSRRGTYVIQRAADEGVPFDHEAITRDRATTSAFPFLDEGIVKVDGHFPYLYELVWPTQLNPPTLAVIGLVQPFGALPPILEMQARWASLVFSGKCTLPSAGKRESFVEKRRAFIKAKYVDSPRYSLQIYFIQYIDRIAESIGCKPHLWKLFFTNPSLWYKVYFGPCTPPQWRLGGPGSWKGAADSIMKVEENTWYPIKTRAAGKGERDGLYDGWVKLLKKIIVFLGVFFVLRYVFSNGYVTFPIKT